MADGDAPAVDPVWVRLELVIGERGGESDGATVVRARLNQPFTYARLVSKVSSPSPRTELHCVVQHSHLPVLALASLVLGPIVL